MCVCGSLCVCECVCVCVCEAEREGHSKRTEGELKKRLKDCKHTHDEAISACEVTHCTLPNTPVCTRVCLHVCRNVCVGVPVGH